MDIDKIVNNVSLLVEKIKIHERKRAELKFKPIFKLITPRTPSLPKCIIWDNSDITDTEIEQIVEDLNEKYKLTEKGAIKYKEYTDAVERENINIDNLKAAIEDLLMKNKQ